jgi:hypothetical protein
VGALDVGTKGRAAEDGFPCIGLEQVSQVGIAAGELLNALNFPEAIPVLPQVGLQGFLIEGFSFTYRAGLIEHFCGEDRENLVR